MTGILFLCLGGGIIIISTAAFAGIELFLKKRKRQLRESAYQIYE